MKIVLISKPDFHIEDSGCAGIIDVVDPYCDVFVRIHSWNEDKNHPELWELNHHNHIRVTIETLDD